MLTYRQSLLAGSLALSAGLVSAQTPTPTPAPPTIQEATIVDSTVSSGVDWTFLTSGVEAPSPRVTLKGETFPTDFLPIAESA